MENLTSLYEWLEKQNLVLCRKVPVEFGDPDYEFVPLNETETAEVSFNWDICSLHEYVEAVGFGR